MVYLGLKSTESSSKTAKTLLKSPTIPLPIFQSRKDECVDKFVAEFQEAIAPFAYSDRDKLLLLKQQVTGRAALLLSSLELDNQSFSSAVKLLKDALALPEQQKFNLMKRLTELNLNYDIDPFIYISQVKSIIEILKF